MQKNADDDANEIIELDSDSETSESEDVDDIFAMEDEMEKQAHLNGTADENRGEKPLNVQKGNHAEIVEKVCFTILKKKRINKLIRRRDPTHNISIQ
jgi:hypothetical protein